MPAEGIAGLEDRPKPGRPAQVDEVASCWRRWSRRRSKLGVTHWSSRLLADHLGGISNVWVARIWRKWGLQPWRRETFKFSTDPELEAKVRDVVGLYLDPPEKAVVLSIDEKSQIQALDRTAPILPMRPGLPEKATHDYVRHGTTTLFAALEIATGKVTDACLFIDPIMVKVRDGGVANRPFYAAIGVTLAGLWWVSGSCAWWFVIGCR